MNYSKFLSPGSFRLKRRALMAFVLFLLVMTELAVGLQRQLILAGLIGLPVLIIAFLYLSIWLERTLLVVLICFLLIRVGIPAGNYSLVPLSLLVVGAWFGIWL